MGIKLVPSKIEAFLISYHFFFTEALAKAIKHPAREPFQDAQCTMQGLQAAVCDACCCFLEVRKITDVCFAGGKSHGRDEVD